MKILQVVQKNLALMGFVPNPQRNNNGSFGKLQTFIICGFVLCTGLIVVYFLHVANSAEEYMYSFFSLTVAVGIGLPFIGFIVNNNKIFDIIDAAEKLINERLENPKSRKIYEKFNHLLEKLSQFIYFAMMCTGPIAMILPKTIVSYFIYFTTDSDGDAFDLPIEMWYPFDWKNPSGYIIAIVVQTIMVICAFHYIACVATVGLGSFLFSISFTEDMTKNLQLINKMPKKVKPKQCEADIFNKFTEFISFHSRVKQLFNDLSYLFEPTIFMVFMCCTILLCVVMLIIQVEITHDAIDSVLLWKSIFLGYCALAVVFFTCEIGQQFTNTLGKVNDKFEQMGWYLYPVKIQRILPTIINNVQAPLEIGCFGIMYCSRDQFKAVVKAVYKSFNVLRKTV